MTPDSITHPDYNKPISRMQLFVVMLVYGLAMIFGGAAITYEYAENKGYEEGLKDGMKSTLLIDPDDYCKALTWEDRK